MLNMRMPHMVIDEVILLIDAYFKIQATSDKALQKCHREDLSATLRALPFFPEFKNNPTFRNVAGMTLLLMNIHNVVTKKCPSNKMSKVSHDVFSRYQENQRLLNNVAQAIKYIGISGIASTFSIDITNNFIGGTVLIGYHNYLETKNNQAVRIRKNFINLNTTHCSLCMDDLSFTYGSKAASLMELHFSAPIEWYSTNMLPSENQYILLCPNCHKFAHGDIGLFSEEILRQAVRL